jgi:hypothetical protein
MGKREMILFDEPGRRNTEAVLEAAQRAGGGTRPTANGALTNSPDRGSEAHTQNESGDATDVPALRASQCVRYPALTWPLRRPWSLLLCLP